MDSKTRLAWVSDSKGSQFRLSFIYLHKSLATDLVLKIREPVRNDVTTKQNAPSEMIEMK